LPITVRSFGFQNYQIVIHDEWVPHFVVAFDAIDFLKLYSDCTVDADGVVCLPTLLGCYDFEKRNSPMWFSYCGPQKAGQ
jgi:hypothetical protein